MEKFPAPDPRPQLFLSLRDLLVDSNMNVEEKEPIRRICREAAAFRGRRGVPFFKVEEFPAQVYVGLFINKIHNIMHSIFNNLIHFLEIHR